MKTQKSIIQSLWIDFFSFISLKCHLLLYMMNWSPLLQKKTNTEKYSFFLFSNLIHIWIIRQLDLKRSYLEHPCIKVPQHEKHMTTKNKRSIYHLIIGQFIFENDKLTFIQLTSKIAIFQCILSSPKTQESTAFGRFHKTTTILKFAANLLIMFSKQTIQIWSHILNIQFFLLHYQKMWKKAAYLTWFHTQICLREGVLFLLMHPTFSSCIKNWGKRIITFLEMVIFAAIFPLMLAKMFFHLSARRNQITCFLRIQWQLVLIQPLVLAF